MDFTDRLMGERTLGSMNPDIIQMSKIQLPLMLQGYKLQKWLLVIIRPLHIFETCHTLCETKLLQENSSGIKSEFTSSCYIKRKSICFWLVYCCVEQWTRQYHADIITKLYCNSIKTSVLACGHQTPLVPHASPPRPVKPQETRNIPADGMQIVHRQCEKGFLFHSYYSLLSEIFLTATWIIKICPELESHQYILKIKQNYINNTNYISLC